MNRATLDDLQGRRSYPSITLLLNTTPGSPLTPLQRDTALRLIDVVDGRLRDDRPTEFERKQLIRALVSLVDEHAGERSTHALALFVSADHAAAVRLGRPVEERVTIDDTFTTRDLVADLNRTALYRVVAVSERVCRMFVGDRTRLVEQRNDSWPLVRTDEHTPTTWARDLDKALGAEQTSHQIPVVVAGVERSVRRLAPAISAIGFVPGNHDRTSATDLHHAAWPLVTDWLRADGVRAMEQLEQARSVNRYAGGIHEIWPLARDGRIDTLVVESGYVLSARIDENGQLVPADDPDHPEVVDDVVDDTIEEVLRFGGNAVIVDDGRLADHQRVAAVVRY